jgi:hypothetical protein
VRANLISLAAGILCLPATYGFTRHGALEFSVAAVLSIAAIGTWLALWGAERTENRPRWWPLAISFACGAITSEFLFFGYYYLGYGHADPKLSVGIALSIVEGGLIAVLGAATVIGTFFAIRRITGASRATR